MVPRALWVFPIGYLFASHVLPNGTRHPNYLISKQGRKVHRAGKILQFSTEITVFAKTVRDRPLVAMEH